MEANGELNGEVPEVDPLCNQLHVLLAHGLRSRPHPTSWLHFAAPAVTGPLALLQVPLYKLSCNPVCLIS